VIFVMVSGPAALTAVTEGPAGVSAGTVSDATVIDMSTAGPDAVARLRSVLPATVKLLDAPVLGSLAEAEAGTLRLLVGGSADAVARVGPLLAVLGDLVHVGPAGTGAAAKLVANSALLGSLGVLGEAVALADGLGIPRDATWRVLATTPLAGQAERRRRAIEDGAYPPRFALALARKDADLIASATGAAGPDLRLAAAIRIWLADAEAAGLGARDYTAVLGHILAAGRPACHGTGTRPADQQ
jgi:3-hydroxyisobutyrate dehydrogenase-like beta-hydroxyacid dehydrogenase